MKAHDVTKTHHELDQLVGAVGTEIPPWQGVPPGHPDFERVKARADEERDLDTEMVIGRTGKPRQAGAVPAYGRDQPWIIQKRELAERSLYYFTKAVMGRKYLSPKLHREICDWLQKCPPRRKCLLLPREHCKSTIVAHSLPIHIQIQPRDANIYFPNEHGLDQRIILMCETEKMGKDRLHVVRDALENNPKIRAFWPHAVWPNPRKPGSKWNDIELILPRKNAYPDPSIRCVGVGGAITGAHPSVLIKDDLVSFDAMNSALVMQEAIDYHRTSRALIGRATCLEFIIGTRWAVYDLYSEIMENDPTVECRVRSIIEEGKSIYPEFFPLERIPELQAEHNAMFPLFYMNSAADPELVDFDMRLVRRFRIEVTDGKSWLCFDDDERDAALSEREGGGKTPLGTHLVGAELTSETYDVLKERAIHLRSFRAC